MTRAHSIEFRQSGMALIITLVFLVIISLVGLTVLNVSTLEEKMASGTRDKDLALQAAEMALLRAEKYIDQSVTGTTTFTDNCTNGLCLTPNSSHLLSRWEDGTICNPGFIWECNKSREVDVSSVSSATFAKNPRFFIEIVRNMGFSEDLVMGNIGDIPAGQSVRIYRITSIGFGGSNESKVILQSTYAKEI